MDVVDRAGGAMLGMAIGEALGAPLEGLTHAKIQERVGRLEGFVDPRKVQPEGRAGYFQIGVYEDETQVALAAADVIIRNNAFLPDAFRDRLGELGQPIAGNAFGALRRAHRNLRISIRKMLAGATWEQSGVKTAGSGAASRGIPIGIFFRSDQAGLLRAAIEAAIVTHRDPRSISACVMMAQGIAQALANDPATLDVDAFVKDLHANCRAGEDMMEAEYRQHLQPGFEPFLHQISDAALLLTELTTLDLEPAFTKIVGHATGKGSRPITLATRGFSMTALLTAYYFFLTGFDVFDETVLDTVAEGGSSDTLGCLVGGLLGALHGVAGIPEDWRKQLKNADQVELRGRILGGAPREGLKSLILLESALTPQIPKPQRKPRPVAPAAGVRGGPRGRGPGRPKQGDRRGPGGGGRPQRSGPPGRGGGRGGRPQGGGGRGFRPGPGRDGRQGGGGRGPGGRGGPERPRPGGPGPRDPRQDGPRPPRPRTPGPRDRQE